MSLVTLVSIKRGSSITTAGRVCKWHAEIEEKHNKKLKDLDWRWKKYEICELKLSECSVYSLIAGRWFHIKTDNEHGEDVIEEQR